MKDNGHSYEKRNLVTRGDLSDLWVCAICGLEYVRRGLVWNPPSKPCKAQSVHNAVDKLTCDLLGESYTAISPKSNKPKHQENIMAKAAPKQIVTEDIDLGLDDPTPAPKRARKSVPETQRAPAAKPGTKKVQKSGSAAPKIFTATKSGLALEDGRFFTVVQAFKSPTKLDVAVSRLLAKGVKAPRSKMTKEQWLRAVATAAVRLGFLKSV